MKFEDETIVEPVKYVDFLGTEEFFSSSPKKNIVFGFGMWERNLILEYEMHNILSLRAGQINVNLL